MTCVSHAAPSAASDEPSLLRGWLNLWTHRREPGQVWHHPAALDDRALRDLGQPRDMLGPPAPRDPAELWLIRVPG